MGQYEKYLKSLPVMPDVAVKILSIAEDKLEISFKELQDTIKVDPGLSTKILKVANSALYSRQKEITSLQMAITLLGFKNIKSLVMLVSASNMFRKTAADPFYSYFWKHSLLTAFVAKDVSQRSGSRDRAEDAFLSGLLHNVGQVALYNSNPQTYSTIFSIAVESNGRISELENRAFGTNHREVGGAILSSWSFPDLYVDVAREHAQDNITSPHKQIIIYVTVADFIASNLDIHFNDPKPAELLGQLLPYTTITARDMDYYHNEFFPSLQEDPLFRESQSLFALR